MLILCRGNPTEGSNPSGSAPENAAFLRRRRSAFGPCSRSLVCRCSRAPRASRAMARSSAALAECVVAGASAAGVFTTQFATTANDEVGDDGDGDPTHRRSGRCRRWGTCRCLRRARGRTLRQHRCRRRTRRSSRTRWPWGFEECDDGDAVNTDVYNDGCAAHCSSSSATTAGASASAPLHPSSRSGRATPGRASATRASAVDYGTTTSTKTRTIATPGRCANDVNVSFGTGPTTPPTRASRTDRLGPASRRRSAEGLVDPTQYPVQWRQQHS